MWFFNTTSDYVPRREFEATLQAQMKFNEYVLRKVRTIMNDTSKLATAVTGLEDAVKKLDKQSEIDAATARIEAVTASITPAPTPVPTPTP